MKLNTNVLGVWFYFWHRWDVRDMNVISIERRVDIFVGISDNFIWIEDRRGNIKHYSFLNSQSNPLSGEMFKAVKRFCEILE